MNLRRAARGLAGIVVLVAPLSAAAQATSTTKAPKPYQGPLDVIMSSHLWTDVPPTQDFVKATHPDAKSIDYTPLSGKEKDPERPKPRDPDGVEALRAELEQAVQSNAKRAVPLGGLTAAAADATDAPAKTAKRHARKTATKPATKTAAE